MADGMTRERVALLAVGLWLAGVAVQVAAWW